MDLTVMIMLMLTSSLVPTSEFHLEYLFIFQIFYGLAQRPTSLQAINFIGKPGKDFIFFQMENNKGTPISSGPATIEGRGGSLWGVQNSGVLKDLRKRPINWDGARSGSRC